MVSDRSTEAGIKKGLSNYLQVAKEVKEREHRFDLTVEE